MAGITSVPPPLFGPKGFTSPASADVLNGAITDINAAFGGGLNPALETPQGQLASSLAAIIEDKNNQFLYIAGQVDPAYAEGRMQDAIGRIYFLSRLPARPTVVTCVCMGKDGVYIPAGALAQATDGQIYTCLTGGGINGGQISLDFACTIPGPILCPKSSLNVVYRSIGGWDSIINPLDGIIGLNVESRAAFESRRSQSVAINAIGGVPSILASVLQVAGVLDAVVVENGDAADKLVNGVNVKAHSVLAVVSGGTDMDVARAIWLKKATGCGYTGTTTVSVEDTHYPAPRPTYSVSFLRPTPTPIFFAVAISNSLSVPANGVDLVQSAIIAAFAGSDGGSRARIGSTMLASRFFGPVAALGPWAQIVSLTIGTVVNGAQSLVKLNIDQQPTISVANITVGLV